MKLNHTISIALTSTNFFAASTSTRTTTIRKIADFENGAIIKFLTFCLSYCRWSFLITSKTNHTFLDNVALKLVAIRES